MMADLIVVAFDNETGADALMRDMQELQKQYIVQLADAAVVVRSQDGKVNVRQAHDLVGAGVLGGSFWGLLVGTLFLVPWLGLAVGAATGAVLGAFSDFGIDDEFIRQVGAQIQPGNSAAFLLIAKSTPDKLIEEFKKFPGGTVLKSSLSSDDEAKIASAMATQSNAVPAPSPAP